MDNMVNTGNKTGLPLRNAVLMCVLFAFSVACFTCGEGLISALFFLAAVASGGVVFCFSQPYILLLSFALGSGVGVLLSDVSPLLAFSVSAVPFLCAVFVGIAVKMKKSLCGVTLAGSAVIFVALICLVLLLMYRTEGSISGAAIISFSEKCYNAIFEIIINGFVYTTEETSVLVVTEEFASGLARAIIAVSPAMVICVSNIISYLCVKLFSRFCIAFGMEDKVSAELFALDMSIVSATVFIMASVMAGIFSYFDEMYLFYYTVSNLQLILVPGFLLIGLKVLKKWFSGRTKRRMGLIGWVCIIMIVFMAIQYLSLIVMILAVIGAISVIRRKAPKIKISKD